MKRWTLAAMLLAAVLAACTGRSWERPARPCQCEALMGAGRCQCLHCLAEPGARCYCNTGGCSCGRDAPGCTCAHCRGLKGGDACGCRK